MIDDERLKDLKESFEFFNNDNKVERDKLVVRYFLEILRVGFDDSDLQPPPECDPIDIRFAGAEFQIKEILDRGRLRHKEYKETLNKSRTLPVHSTPRDITLTEIYSEILFFISSHELLQKYAPAVCRGLDLLFYIGDYQLDKVGQLWHHLSWGANRLRRAYFLFNLAYLFYSTLAWKIRQLFSLGRGLKLKSWIGNLRSAWAWESSSVFCHSG